MEKRTIGIYALVALVVLPLCYVGMGLGTARAPSEYTGYVVDVEEDRGPPLLRTTQLKVKTHPRSSTTETFCVAQDSEVVLETAYDAMGNQTRVTIDYERPFFVPRQQCQPQTSLVQNITLSGDA